MKKTISKIAASFALAMVTVSGGFAQTNLGASCGCPTPVSSRPTVLLSTLASAVPATDGDLTATNTILDCSKTWILDKKIYVPDGKSLTILPGTVIKGRSAALPADATALIVSRGGKIFASGSATCQIVFTAEADNLDGSYPLANKGMWGGLVIAGKATNNLTLAANGPFSVANKKLAVADGLGTFEGFPTTNIRDQFGVDLSTGSFDDNDNSGMLRYISIRHSGAILTAGGEINGLTLGSVGRGTTIDHIEIVSGADDAIEFFGGTVNIKYAATFFGNDDMYDWDLGYTGKSQFIFGIKSSGLDTAHTAGNFAPDADNGFEMDADDNNSNLFPRSHPIIYNTTFIGNDKSVLSSDNSGLAAIEAKELTEGEIYNSVFANFRYGLNLIKTLAAPRTLAAGGNAWHNWSTASGTPNSGSLKVKCNAFIGMTNDYALDKNNAVAFSTADTAQFYTTDANVRYTSAPTGFVYNWSVNGSTNAVSTKFSATPSPALGVNIAIPGCATPADGFFVSANYKGAFAAGQKSWLSDWSYAQVLNVTGGLAPCPTDINGDGVTNNVDFLALLAQFNLSCN